MDLGIPRHTLFQADDHKAPAFFGLDMNHIPDLSPGLYIRLRGWGTL
jgi:hypothetical protein